MSSGFPPSGSYPSGSSPFGEHNPYQSPNMLSGGGGFPGAGREAAMARVKLPAIFLMILAPLGMALFAVDGYFRVMNLQSGEIIAPLGDKDAPGVKEGYYAGQYGGLAVDFLGFFLQILVIFGAYHMMSLQNRTLAFSASVISCIPCLTACCVLGIPFGIWALVVINDSAVKQHFRS
jgi:hypothetical protein